MAITVLKKRQKKALAIAFLTLALVGLVIPITVHAAIDFMKTMTKETVVWKITNETDVIVSGQYTNSSGVKLGLDAFSSSSVDDEGNLIVYVATPDDADSSAPNYIWLKPCINGSYVRYSWLLENNIDEIKISIESDFNFSDVKIMLQDMGAPNKARFSYVVNGSTFDITFSLDLPTLLTAKSETDDGCFLFVIYDENYEDSEAVYGHTYIIKIYMIKHEHIDYELYKNILIGGSGILMFFAGVFALPNVSLAELDNLLRRRKARRAMAGSVLALLLVGLTIAVVYYLSGSILMTLMGFFVGVLGYYALSSSRRLSGSKAGISGWLGSMFGAISDHFTQMQSTIISGVLQGDLACILWLVGYVWLLLVLIYNFVTTGKVWR